MKRQWQRPRCLEARKRRFRGEGIHGREGEQSRIVTFGSSMRNDPVEWICLWPLTTELFSEQTTSINGIQYARLSDFPSLLMLSLTMGTSTRARSAGPTPPLTLRQSYCASCSGRLCQNITSPIVRRWWPGGMLLPYEFGAVVPHL